MTALCAPMLFFPFVVWTNKTHKRRLPNSFVTLVLFFSLLISCRRPLWVAPAIGGVDRLLFFSFSCLVSNRLDAVAKCETAAGDIAGEMEEKNSRRSLFGDGVPLCRDRAPGLLCGILKKKMMSFAPTRRDHRDQSRSFLFFSRSLPWALLSGSLFSTPRSKIAPHPGRRQRPRLARRSRHKASHA